MNQKPVILVVDDATLNLQTLAHILKNDYTVKIAHSGEKALELARQDPLPEVILLDVEMPHMDGYAVCEHLQKNTETSSIPVIFVTGKDSREEEERGLSLGAVDYITKPLHPSIIKARLKTHITLKHQHDLLKTVAMRDQLTGLYNRHYLTDILISKVTYATRHKEPLSVVLIDIDFFKAINDTYGHLVGDDVLREIGGVIERNARSEDVAARFGGEEFILLLHGCDRDGAVKKAEFLRQEIEAHYPVGIDVTASFGVVQFDETMETCTHFLDYADQALYKAKKKGRNQVIAHKNH